VEVLRSRAGEAVRDPVFWTDTIQLVKAVVAAVVSWVLASRVLGLPQSFLAPWSALLVVHGTVYRTFSHGAKQVAGAVVGVLIAWLVGNFIGSTPMGLTLVLFAGLVVGQVGWLRDEATTAATTGLFVLTAGYSTDDWLLLDRLLDTAVGIVVGLAVNLLVWPPLRDYAAARAIDAIDDGVGDLLCRMAADLQAGCGDETVGEWVDRTRSLDHDIDHAWSMVRQARESSRLNPRRSAVDARTTKVYESILRDNEQAVAEARSMARTVGISIDRVVEWEGEFRARWLALLQEAGEAIGAPDSARVSQVHADLTRLADDLSSADLPRRHWPEYGALIMNLRNVVASMDRVAEQNPVVVPRYQRRRQKRRQMRERLVMARPPGSWTGPRRRRR
jgi:uncharacterized membrane protein (GlpM family)